MNSIWHNKYEKPPKNDIDILAIFYGEEHYRAKLLMGMNFYDESSAGINCVKWAYVDDLVNLKSQSFELEKYKKALEEIAGITGCSEEQGQACAGFMNETAKTALSQIKDK